MPVASAQDMTGDDDVIVEEVNFQDVVESADPRRKIAGRVDEKKEDPDDAPPAIDDDAADDAPAPAPPKRFLKKTLGDAGGHGWEKPRSGQDVLATFAAWPRPEGPLPDALDEKDFDLCGATTARELQVVRVREAPPAAPPGLGDDDLDEWLQIPPPIKLEKAGYAKALDDALCELSNGESCLYETLDHGGWRLRVELHEILAERHEIEQYAATSRGHGGLAGRATTRRLRHVGDGTRTAAGETATNGCGVRGTLRLVAGWDAAAGRAAWAPPRDWFGLSTDPGQGSTSAPSKNTPEVFSVRLGDGRCAEGFEACLKGIKKGTVARCHVAGECLLPDEVSGAHVDAVVPEGWWRDAEARYRDGRDARQATKGLPRVVVDVCIEGIDDTLKKARDPMTASLPEKDRWSQVLKERGARLFRAKRFRRAEAVWHDGVKMFSFWKPEDSGLDPGDYHLRENARSRTLSIPLMLNEAMLMRKRRAFKDAELSLNECIENDGNHVKALFRRGQVRVDLQKWELAKDDLRRAIDLGGAAVEADVARELARLKKMERAQDAKDGKGMKHTFDDDRDAIYGEKVSNEKRVARAKAEVKAAAAKRDAGLFSVDAGVREDVKKTSSQKPSDYDWTSSYHTGDRPAYETAAAADPNPSNRPVLVDDLDAELEEISDEEEEAKRAAKQEYYNTQIGLGNMRVQLPPPGQGSAGEGGE